jgi:threonine dehydrogenase-like Zn-dependent dehydrogenase
MVPAIATGPTALASPTAVSSPPPSSDSPAAVAVTRPGRSPSRSKPAAVGSRPWPPKVPNSRQKLAAEFGATDIVAERGPDGAAQVMNLLAGVGADCVLECVGTQDSLDQAVAVTRPGGMIGCVGAPFYDIPAARLAGRNIGLRGGVAPVRAYLPALLADVLAGVIRPGKVFDLELPLADVSEAYRAMDDRRAIKVLLRP